jgi:hypothetical protein
MFQPLLVIRDRAYWGLVVTATIGNAASRQSQAFHATRMGIIFADSPVIAAIKCSAHNVSAAVFSGKYVARL